MPRKIDDSIIGEQFGMLTVLGLSEKRSKVNPGKYTYWDCQCECGKCTVIQRNNLISGSVNSCGCLQYKRFRKTG
jgi:hypothetical protein|tara:strand:- start:211 stop:435 length:225 start_codon:yes stop_codon:yes gene_type:complete